MDNQATSERATTFVDLEPAARRLADLVISIPDSRLEAPTPCPEYSLGDLLEHVGGLALAFTAAATKAFDDAASQAPSGDASRLGDGWRPRIARDLVTMAQAWHDREAWSGMTMAGGVDLPGEVAGLVALDELVVLGWDVARAAGRPYACDAPSLEALHGFVSQFADPDPDQAGALFGPAVPVPDNAPLLDRVIGLTGRDPAWSAPGH